MVRLNAFRSSAAISVLAAVVASSAVIATPTPAAARVDISIGFNAGGIGFGYFHRNLGRRGHWINHPRWGDVWQPPHARSYRPYFNGYFEYTDYGLLWVGNDPWSNVTDHYGRWVYDPYYGALWIPGYVWAPAWVIFREGGGYFGWFPMPPDYGNFDDGPYYGGHYGWNDYYGYGDWYGMSNNSFYNLWIFVDEDHFYRHDYRNYVVDSRRVRNIINRTSDTTNYSMSGDHIVNRSISSDRLERITHQRIRPVEARTLLKGDVPMAPISAGRGLARQEGSGRAGPHLHDSNFKPIAAPAGNENKPGNERGMKPGGKNEAMPAPQPMPNAGEEGGRKGDRGGKNETTPAPQPMPNAGEESGRGGKRGGKNEATPAPAPQPMPNAGEEGGRKGDRGGKNEATPAPQPMPNAGEEGGRKGDRGGKNEAAPAPQPMPNAGEENKDGTKRGGKNEATPAPQSQPAGAEEGGKQRKPGNAEDKSPGASPGATGPGAQGSEGPNAGGKKKGKEQPVKPDEDKDKKKPNSDENGPGQ